MDQNQTENPNYSIVQVEDKEIHLLGTAHVSKESVNEVNKLSQELKPDSICIELCPARHQTIVNRESWRQMDIFKIIRQKKALFMLIQLVLSSFYRKIGQKLGVQPGAEMLAGVEQARSLGSCLILADRDVNITLKRVWGSLSFLSKCKMFFQMLGSIFVQDEIDSESIEKLKEKDQLEMVMESLGKSFPEIKTSLIDERDIYLSQKIKKAPGKKIMAIVGAGHLKGILQNIQLEQDLAPLEVIPAKSIWPKLFKWGIPILILILLGLSFFKGGAEHSVQSIWIWILVNGTLSSLCVALALAHPLTIASTFLAAPLTSLNPTIAAGWIAGLVQAWVKKPTVADLENLPQAITSLKGFWLNPLCRILLVVVLANIGSSFGTFIAGSWIAARFF